MECNKRGSLVVLVLLVLIPLVSAQPKMPFNIYGHVYDTKGNILYNEQVTLLYVDDEGNASIYYYIEITR